MKILVGSDICWESGIYSDTSENSKKYLIEKRKYISQNFKKIQKVISTENPDLLLLLGDIISDGSCSFTHEKLLAKLLKEININTLLIRGNHDYSPEWEYFLNEIKTNEKVINLQADMATLDSLNFLGVPYEITHSKVKLRELLNKNYNVDFVLAHVEGSRRIWLTDIKTRIIISGHFGYGYFFTPGKNLMFFTGNFPFTYLIFEIGDTNKINVYLRSLDEYHPIDIEYDIDLEQKYVHILDRLSNNRISDINNFLDRIDKIYLEGEEKRTTTHNGYYIGKEQNHYITYNEFEIYQIEKNRLNKEKYYSNLKKMKELYCNDKITKEELGIMKVKYGIFQKHIDDYVLRNKKVTSYLPNKDEIIVQIQKLNSNNISLNSGNIQKHYNSLFQKAIRGFKSWEKAVQAAGFDYTKIKNVRLNLDVPDKEVIKQVLELDDKGVDLSYENIRKSHSKLFTTARKKFGNWEKAINACNLDYSKIRKHKKFDSVIVINAIKEVYSKKGNLSSGYIQQNNSSLFNAALQYFGSWKKAIEFAGYNYDKIKKRGTFI